MPLTDDVDVTDNLVVNFDNRNEDAQNFTVTIANKGKRSIKVKKISSSLDFIGVLNYNESNSIIKANTQIEYLFEAKQEQQKANDLNEGKIRFTFKDHSHVTRSIKITNDTAVEMKCILPATAPVVVPTTTDTKNDDKTHPMKVSLTPGIINLQGFIKRDIDIWIEKFGDNNRKAIDITDNLQIEFDYFHSSQLCEVLVRNNTWKSFHLDAIDMDESMISMCEEFNGKTIEPRDDLKLHFKAIFDTKKIASQTQIRFWFGEICLRRTIAIQYRARGSAIPKNYYNIPDALNELIAKQYKISRSEYMDALDKCVPSPTADYAKHFHNLVYLEECSLRRQIERNYLQKQAFFGDQEYCQDGKRKKYDRGIYDLEIKDLFEIRPSLQPGDKVIARKHSALEIAYEGVLIAMKDGNLVCIQFNDDFVETFDNKAYRVEFDFSRTSFIRMHFAIDMALKLFGLDILLPNEISIREEPLLGVRLSKKANDLKLANTGTTLKWFNSSLNENQRKTVANILRGDMLNPYVIYGPPGTGKTTTLTEIILQVFKNIKNSRILVATQSNSAANLIAQRLVVCNEIDSNTMLRLISHNYAKNSNMIPEEIMEYVKTIDDLMPGLESNYFKCLAMLPNYKIIIGTSSTIAHLLESFKLQNTFTHAIIDEAGQNTEPSVLVPMVLVGGTRGQIIMAGDPMQMAPICFGPESNTRGLSVSMIKRLYDCYQNIKPDRINQSRISYLMSPTFKLIHNYRSVPSILNYYNTQFYDSELVPMIDSKASPDAKLLAHFSPIFQDNSQSNEYGIYFIDINGKNVVRKHSWANIIEAQVIEKIVDCMMMKGLNSNDVGVIAPYILQVRAIEHWLKKYPDIKVGTVEEFQGLERKIILISTTRTCPGGMKIDVSRHLGFVKCPKRINVAVSRARSLVIVVGKGELLSVDENWNALIEGCKKHGTYVSSKKE